jgi:hypothetical protein
MYQKHIDVNIYFEIIDDLSLKCSKFPARNLYPNHVILKFHLNRFKSLSEISLL